MCYQSKIINFLLFFVMLALPFALFGQKVEDFRHAVRMHEPASPSAEAYSWALFVEEYLQSLTVNDDEAVTSDDYQSVFFSNIDELEDIHLHPIPINSASREDLQRIVFLSDEQIEEILIERECRRGGYFSLGELMTVRSLNYRDRAWLSLLLDFSPAKADTFAIKVKTTDNPRQTAAYHKSKLLTENRWHDGSHEVLAGVSVPLQSQAGFHDYDADNYRSKMFTGYPIGHVVKYRYNWRHRLRYGATVEEDVGERWSAYGGKPWDFNSFHFFYQTNPITTNGERFSRAEFSVGDYRINLGQGLAVGSNSWGQFSSLLTGFRQESVRLSPHTGTDESNFFRGVAAHVRLGAAGQWPVTAFASWRKLDGSVKVATAANDYSSTASDTITAWKTDGLHRTLQEISKLRVAEQWVGGARFGYQNRWLNVGADVVGIHYDKVYWPAARMYNKYYMRGTDAMTIGADCAMKLGKWSLQGELQFNANAAHATTAVLRWQPLQAFHLVLQHRSFAKNFISPLGNTLQAGSHIQNEEGTMIGFRYNGPRRFILMGYADYTYHRHPVYLADTTSHKVEAMLQCNFRTGSNWTNTLQYKLKTREQNVTGYKGLANFDGVLLSWRTTQHLRWQSTRQTRAWNTTIGADGTMYYSQGSTIDKKKHVTPIRSLGGLIYCRSSYDYRKLLKVSVMGAAFVTDDYNTRCYAYVPQLRSWSIGFPMFHGKGLMGNFLLDATLWRGLSAGVSTGVTKYFDRDNVGTGVNLISSSFKADLALQLRWLL